MQTAHIARAIDPNPSEAQKEAGNYRKAHVRIHGLDIAIENARGANREGIHNGKSWRVCMPAHYGYIKRTEGADGDHVDAYIGPHTKCPRVFIINQKDAKTGKFDEHKAFLGFATKQQVINTYRKAFSDGKSDERMGYIAEMSVEQFKDWLASGDTVKPIKRAAGGRVNGMVEPGNIDLANRPVVHNADGSISTVRSIGANVGGKEVLLPTVSHDGAVLSNDDAIRLYQMSGKHLGIFDTPENSDAYAQSLHDDQAQMYEGRANGGRAAFADGGAPSFDPSQPFEPVGSAPSFDPSKPFEPVSKPDKGALNAAGRGAMQGVTFNFADELRGLGEAGGVKADEWNDPVSTAKGAYRYWAGDKDAEKTYNEAVAREREADEAAKSQHPWAYNGAEIAGSLPAMAAIPGGGIVRGAGIGTKILQGAKVGAEYGALSGAGEGTDANSRVLGSATGAASGAVGGAAAPIAGAGIGLAYDRFGKPLVSAARGLINPEAEAGRRVAAALSADAEAIAAGKAEGMTAQQWAAAKAAGEPVTLADLGAGNTQSLLRSSANTSPEGRAMLEKVINDRFAGQSERVADDVRGLVSGGANAGKTADQLVAEYDQKRLPAYKAAFAHPNAQAMWNGDLEQMSQAPVVQNAIRMATVNAKNEAAKLGLTPPKVSPFTFNDEGRMVLRTNPDGSTMTPNLQFWDVVKKNLDKMGQDGQGWSKVLRDHLDDAVPQYGKARGIASQFFGERDALEAGRTLAGKRVDPDIIKGAMRKMSPEEQELFREGYASDWAGRVIGDFRDSRDITKAMFNSPNERARAEAIFGKSGIDKIQTRMTLETIMDGARKAMGNSTTARQLIEAGLAGGALGGYLDGDWKGAAAGFASGAGARKALSTEMAAGARKIIGHVDAKTARNVAEMLTSSDPSRLAQGMRMATSNKKIADGLRSIADRVALSGQTAAPRIPLPYTGPNLGPLQGSMPVHANDEKPKP